MSQLETNPLANPTILVKKPHQMMEVLPAAQMTNFSFDPPGLLRPTKIPSTYSQHTWSTHARQNKFLQNFAWRTTSARGTALFTREITPSNLYELVPLGKTQNSWFDFEHVQFSIKSTANAFYAGLLLVCFDPSPSPSYYTEIGRPPSLADYWQFSNIMISPKTSGEVNFEIPLAYPFNKFRVPTGKPSNPTQDARNSYYSNYPMGRFFPIVFSPLSTKATILELNYTLSGAIIDLSTEGAYVMQSS